jgi:4'-phosphopantetheinyl transferase
MDTTDAAYSGLFAVPTTLPVEIADDEVHVWRAGLDLPPADLRFRSGPKGKPALIGEPGWLALQFSMSHSHLLGLYVVARDRRVGVDVEWVRTGRAYSRLADRHFGVAEVVQLEATPAHLRERAFLSYWTRKEAYVKAIGEGLPALPDTPDLMTLPPGNGAGWHVCRIDVGPEYTAAAAVEGEGCKMRFLQWSRLYPSSATGGLA